MFIDKVFISELDLDFLQINDGNFKEILNTLVTMQNCQIIFTGKQKLFFMLTIDDLKLIVEKDVKVTFLDSYFLDTDKELNVNGSYLLKSSKKMRHLTNFCLGEEFDGRILPMDLLADLPFQEVRSLNFSMQGEENIRRTVETLSIIKSLKKFDMQPDHRSDYKLSPKDLRLFGRVPVKDLNLIALDLRKDNLDEFSLILQEMEIEEIVCYDEELEHLEITIKSFGPGGLCKTI